ncbi:Aste57867_5075 [Aphanomyces stellatus]|uniref:Aste57867_5075 protein n=1 Tax=Aphanomyces stellatus TaxID=120398 RepID=A0A485KH41_9STRA|nr:hypothetical protein As57867_005062 [Aphanomyces stellatus]VFT82156.1 Aste57867_5075 [Aphanomyces stellatus]
MVSPAYQLKLEVNLAPEPIPEVIDDSKVCQVILENESEDENDNVTSNVIPFDDQYECHVDVDGVDTTESMAAGRSIPECASETCTCQISDDTLFMELQLKELEIQRLKVRCIRLTIYTSHESKNQVQEIKARYRRDTRQLKREIEAARDKSVKDEQLRQKQSRILKAVSVLWFIKFHIS